MRLEWLEDLVAIFETGSLNEAAARRYLTQPAFSRRVRTIEEYLGVELLDRSRKPARPAQALLDQEGRLRDVAESLRELIHDLRQKERGAQNRVVIASQHAITTAFLPSIIARDFAGLDLTIRLRSANRAECSAMLITKEADLTVTYRSTAEARLTPEEYIEEKFLDDEILIPIYAPSLEDELESGKLPLIAYPSEVFLGALMQQEILRPVAERYTVTPRVETALTLAALQLAIAGVGVAWAPASLAAGDIEKGRVRDASRILPTGRVAIMATRLIGQKSPVEDLLWSALPDAATPPVAAD